MERQFLRLGFDPKLLELMKNSAESRRTGELVKRTEWSYSLKPIVLRFANSVAKRGGINTEPISNVRSFGFPTPV
jgi:hypothetical protein